MLFAWIVACAARNGDLPGPDAQDRGPAEAEPASRDDGVAGGTPPTPPTLPPPSPGMGDLGGMAQTTHMAVARLEPVAGSRVSGMVSLTETRMGGMGMGHHGLDHDAVQPGGGAAGSMDGGATGSTDGGATMGGMTTASPTTGTAQPSTQDMGATGHPRHEVKVTVDLRGAMPGLHGVAIHERGDCSNDARNIGNHFNPLNRPHGDVVGVDHHPGDLGNVVVGSDGSAYKEVTLSSITLGEGPLSVEGLSVVVYENRDDFTQPLGNTGRPIACGVITAQVAGK